MSRLETEALSQAPTAEKSAGKPSGGKTFDRSAEGFVKKTEPGKEERKQGSGGSQPISAEQKELQSALNAAEQSVKYFASNGKRHTNAIKCVHDYIDIAVRHCHANSEPSDGQRRLSLAKILQDVESMLSQLGNWQGKPSWIKPADRPGLLQSNKFDELQMKPFDGWYEQSAKPFRASGSEEPDVRLAEIKDHLQMRVAIESVKNHLTQRPSTEAAISEIVQRGFEIASSGKLPNGEEIPDGSTLVVFERKNMAGQDAVLPFHKIGQDKQPHIQWFDIDKIRLGEAKRKAILNGPQELTVSELYGFRLDHDPLRLFVPGKDCSTQVGFAILAPDAKAKPQWGNSKNTIYFEGEVTQGLRVKCDTTAGTNTGVLFNLLRRFYQVKNSNDPGQANNLFIGPMLDQLVTQQ